MTARAHNSLIAMFDKTCRCRVRSMSNVVRRWLIVGTGIGIEIRERELKIAVVRVRPKGAETVGELIIPAFAERPPSVWSAEYNTFLGQLGVARTGAVVLLPRAEVTSRTVNFLGISDGQVPSALRFEMESLWPGTKEKAVYDWTRIGKTASILVAMTSPVVVQCYAELFKEANIKVSHFTYDAAALYSSVHLFGYCQGASFLTIIEDQGEQVVYGESPSNPLFSVRLDTSLEKVRSWALAQLRMDPESRVTPISEVLPTAVVSSVRKNSVPWSMACVTALCAGNPWFINTLNLLPREHRRGILRTVYMPTFILLALMSLALGSLACFSVMTQAHYRRAVRAAVEMIEPLANKSDELDRSIAALRRQTHTIDSFRMRSKDDLDALSELTQLIAPPSWVRSLLLTRRGLSLTGEADQAAGLLKVIDGSIQFRSTEFSTPVAREGRLERFSIRATRKVVSHETY